MSKPKSEKEWEKDIGKKLGFTSQELARGGKHPLIRLLKDVAIDLPTITSLMNTNPVTDRPYPAPDPYLVTEGQVWGMMLIIAKGMLKANRDLNNGKTNEQCFPKKIIVRFNTGPAVFYHDSEGKATPDPDSIYIDPSRFLREVIRVKAADLRFEPHHSALKGQTQTWDEVLYMVGYEEECHVCQHKIAALRAEMEQKTRDLVEAAAYEKGSYTGGDAHENHAGLMLSRALPAYRSAKVSR